MNRVFLSYTAKDLGAHAIAAKQSAELAGWEAVDHRDWAPNGRPSVSECMKQVDGCDALIVLSGGRYGWVPTKAEGGDGRRSITWLEVARARSRGIAVIPLLLEDAEVAQVAVEPEEGTHTVLAAFRGELQQSLAGFFTSQPSSVDVLVKQGLDAWDGRANDERMPWRRRLRKVAPAILAMGVATAWLLAGPLVNGRLTTRPQPSLAAWLQSGQTIVVVSLALALIAFWSFAASRGRPQWMYRVFPLSNLGDALLATAFLVAIAAGVGGTLASQGKDPYFEAALTSILDGVRSPAAAGALQPERWRGAKYEGDIKALREFVLPVLAARRNLSDAVALAGVRESLRRMTAPTDVLDIRVRMLVEIARFHVVAIQQDAGRALAHFGKSIEPLFGSVDAIWRAEALYARAGWIDYWAFTNMLEPLDRTGAPAYSKEEVLGAFDDVLKQIGDRPGKPAWVTCGARTNGSMVRARLCGGTTDGECTDLDDRLREAVACFESRQDHQGVQTAKHNLALRLLASRKLQEAYGYFRSRFDESGDRGAGLQALGIEVVANAAPAGQTLDPALLEAELTKETDRRRQGEFKACLALLADTRRGGDTQNTRSCRVAFTCYLTDNPVANERFCGVPDIPRDGAVLASDPKPVFVPTRYPSRYVASGKVSPTRPAKDVVAECDGDVEAEPSFVIDLARPARIAIRVVSGGDSVLLVRGPMQSACADDAPIPGRGKSSDAGMILEATAGRHEFFVGTYGHQSLGYEAVVSVGDAGQ